MEKPEQSYAPSTAFLPEALHGKKQLSSNILWDPNLLGVIEGFAGSYKEFKKDQYRRFGGEEAFSKPGSRELCSRLKEPASSLPTPKIVKTMGPSYASLVDESLERIYTGWGEYPCSTIVALDFQGKLIWKKEMDEALHGRAVLDSKGCLVFSVFYEDWRENAKTKIIRLENEWPCHVLDTFLDLPVMTGDLFLDLKDDSVYYHTRHGIARVSKQGKLTHWEFQEPHWILNAYAIGVYDGVMHLEYQTGSQKTEICKVNFHEQDPSNPERGSSPKNFTLEPLFEISPKAWTVTHDPIANVFMCFTRDTPGFVIYDGEGGSSNPPGSIINSFDVEQFGIVRCFMNPNPGFIGLSICCWEKNKGFELKIY